MIFSSCIPRRHVPYFLYSSYACPARMDSRSEQKDSIFAVSSFATRQSFLYRQSSQSKKMTAGLSAAADVSGTAGSAIAAAVVLDREAGLRRCDVRVGGTPLEREGG